ncbi:TolC family protein [Clostridium chromiireducens]|uniref:Outer membrane efflux protein n=1 Tax=Clostridium chromiireducens TaxID=225345 RepID=A0A1V4IR14_9CLOT|nr:TolC family protein [Clostridium chromiireducens]OPJ62353.1 outer membrane efflux protein [Clostridium chromiireducens]RII34545.1 TolC family protein [Clostridium chromiireducens]
MKKTLISFLIMTLIASSCISAFNTQKVYADSANTSSAETLDDSTIKVSLENIRDIMTENNLDIKILDNKLKIAKENYDDAKSSYTSKTEPKQEDYKDVNGNDDTVAYKKAKDEYDSYKDKYESYKNDLKTARNNYDKGVEDQVYSAQQAYITYLYDLSQKNILEETKNQNERKDQIYKIQYDSGFISKNKYTSLLQGNTSTNDAASSKDTVELDRIKLCNTLGISPEEKVIFNTDITQDFQVISKINYEDDLKKMLDNNIEIQVQNDEISDLDDKDDDTDVYDYQVDNANMELKKLINDTETGFKSKYNDLITSYNSVKSSYDVINQKQVEYEITQTKYDYGFVSKNDMDAAKLTLDNDNADFINKRNECYLKYLKYIEMKEGY